MLKFGRAELGGEVGFTLVLHTWDQLLRPHFHLHGLMASGALSADGERWIAGGKDFLFAVRALSKVFRGKFLAGFESLLCGGALTLPRDFGPGGKHPRALVRRLYRKSWVVYSKPPYAGPAKLLDYLSRYTHRVAISNDRLIRCTSDSVEFFYRDRRDGDRRKLTSLPPETFLRRFLCHVLPERFTRIRHYGFLANRHRREKLEKIRRLVGMRRRPDEVMPATLEWVAQLLGVDLNRCPRCDAPLCVAALPRDERYWQRARPRLDIRGSPERSP